MDFWIDSDNVIDFNKLVNETPHHASNNPIDNFKNVFPLNNRGCTCYFLIQNHLLTVRLFKTIIILLFGSFLWTLIVPNYESKEINTSDNIYIN
jgi:hypothetical protein